MSRTMNEKIIHITNIKYGKNHIPYRYLFFQHSLELTFFLFKNFFNVDLQNNRDYVVDIYESIEEATAYYRGAEFIDNKYDINTTKINIEEFFAADDVLMIGNKNIVLNTITFLIKKLYELTNDNNQNILISTVWNTNQSPKYVVTIKNTNFENYHQEFECYQEGLNFLNKKLTELIKFITDKAQS